MENKYTAEVPIDLNGETFTLTMGWPEIAQLQGKHGKDALRRLFDKPIDEIAEILAVGLSRHHPGFTKEMVLEASPPLMPTLVLLDRVITFSYFGAEGPARDAESVESAEDSKKKPETK